MLPYTLRYRSTEISSDVSLTCSSWCFSIHVWKHQRLPQEPRSSIILFRIARFSPVGFICRVYINKIKSVWMCLPCGTLTGSLTWTSLTSPNQKEASLALCFSAASLLTQVRLRCRLCCPVWSSVAAQKQNQQSHILWETRGPHLPPF